MQISSSPPPLAERFAAILAALVVAVRANGAGSRVFQRIWPVLWNRVMAVRDAVLAVMAQIEAGTVRPVRVRAARVRRTREAPAKGVLSEKFLAWRGVPTWAGWVVGQGGWRVAAYLGQLEHLLRDPEMMRLLAASPRLGQALRPLCRMLGVTPALYDYETVCAQVAAMGPAEAAPLESAPEPAPDPAPVATAAPEGEVDDPARQFIPFWLRSLPG